MQRHARLITRFASAGLSLVFVALVVCTLWGATMIKRAAAQTVAAVTLSERYELLKSQLSVEASFVRIHGFDPEGSGWNEERPAAIQTEATLNAIGKIGSSEDRAIAGQTTVDHDHYLDVLLILFSKMDNNAPGVATTFKRSLQISERMLGRIATRATEQHQAALASLANLTSTQEVVVRTILVASALGVLLLSSCLFVIATYRRAAEVARKNEMIRLAAASLTDPLTGLGNHQAYQEHLVRELARMNRHGGTLTLALIDIDNFKDVNDSLGHIHGDRVLASLGELLRGLRKFDLGFRLGGDEFGVVLPLTNSAEAIVVMERLRQSAPTCLQGSTISIGLSSTDAFDMDAITLRAQADAALYAAKHHGRNSIMTYADARSKLFVQSTQKARAIHRLIENGCLDVVFQPIWDVRSQTPLGFEALVRPAETYGFAGPQEAFDVAEQMGLAPALDAICIRAILARAGELPPHTLLFINIVPETLDSDLVAGDNLATAVRAAGLTPNEVVIELTERSMQRLDVIVREAKRLQGIGFQVALDDTGAGNAGLEILRRLPVEFVKIDRMVVVQAMTDPIAHAIVSGVVEIARAMGSYVIAEGIETVEALTFICNNVTRPSLDDFAIGGAQGYLLGRPEGAPWTRSQREACALLAQARERPRLTA